MFLLEFLQLQNRENGFLLLQSERKNVKLRAWDEVTALPRLVFFFRIIFSTPSVATRIRLTIHSVVDVLFCGPSIYEIVQLCLEFFPRFNNFFTNFSKKLHNTLLKMRHYLAPNESFVDIRPSVPSKAEYRNIYQNRLFLNRKRD